MFTWRKTRGTVTSTFFCSDIFIFSVLLSNHVFGKLCFFITPSVQLSLLTYVQLSLPTSVQLSLPTSVQLSFPKSVQFSLLSCVQFSLPTSVQLSSHLFNCPDMFSWPYLHEVFRNKFSCPNVRPVVPPYNCSVLLASVQLSLPTSAQLS